VLEVLHAFNEPFDDVKKKTLCLRNLKSWQENTPDAKMKRKL